ncbi:glycoside hydrolase family 38 C-terminal domain-containing protein [Paenibacillus chibensis]|uniref:glycoside hydrolase family 38 N-terminal domain-containing protein n=1 Tax=Paenibacillus chibensis TaxID=59846 RepID=UPI000FDAECAF|nr:glycoside hydrolase family 38 C-terminal domain-containing protein [Paenibacillus chibensis]MEC0369135.1 glycoside hydrolase family 38 C-terminal domain-containing protein [Paenibacillus chibensis]
MSLEQQIKQAEAPLPTRKWTIYAIHHSHTDLGYTERQEKIEQYHVDFIRQALRIARAAHEGTKPSWKGFRWTCETFWAVEQFLKAASAEEKQSFADAVLRGDLELSGTYLNMTELPDERLLGSIHSKAQAYAASIGSHVDSAMTADINGYGWGYADSLLNNGIRHLFSCIHTHHGMYALGRKQAPFWWETRDGKRLLVWNGEHYMIGNELGLCPGALGKYMIRDEFEHQLVEPEAIHDAIATLRIHRYLAQLEAEQYPYAFVPVMLSGLGTDNGAPNSRIIEWIAAWNELYGEQISIEMTTLSGFFARLKQEDLDALPVHRGDWPDWWTDGVSSTPMHTQIYRDAQRTLRKAEKLDPEARSASRAELNNIEQQLTLYAEHTWGYHSSIYEPWHKNVQLLEVRKQAHAAEASRLAYRALDKVLLAQGGAALYPDRPYRFRVSNLSGRKVTELVTLQLDGWEPGALREGVEVVREDTGEVLPQQSAHPQTIVTELKLGAQETCFLFLRPLTRGHRPGTTTSNTRLIGADRVYDMDDLVPPASAAGEHPPIRITHNGIESPFLRLTWSENGIRSWFNKEQSREMLRSEDPYGAFTPIYEVTRPADPTDASQVWSTRARMGRNRKGIHVERSAGRVVSARTVENGPLYATVEITYQLNGLSYFALFLRVHAGRNRVDVSARFHKDSVWSPENLYLSLPFTSGDAAGDTLYADKPGGLVRPWKDQIPGTCLDYACVQEGIAWQDEQSALLLASPDTPLMQWGPLEYGTRRVHTQQGEEEKPEAYAWLMTNYWETNFKATLGGFYEFVYHVFAQPAMPEAELAAAIRALHDPFVVCRMRPSDTL